MIKKKKTIINFFLCLFRGQPASSARHPGEHPADAAGQRPDTSPTGQSNHLIKKKKIN